MGYLHLRDSEIAQGFRFVRAVLFFRQESARNPANAVSPLRWQQAEKKDDRYGYKLRL